jgi:hypothetical protein
MLLLEEEVTVPVDGKILVFVLLQVMSVVNGRLEAD